MAFAISRQTTTYIYESFATVGEIRVWWRADFQSGSRVLKKLFWTFSYLYLWHTMWFHAKKLLKTLKFWKSLNSLCKSGSRPQKSPKKPKKRTTQSRFWVPPGESSCPDGSEYIWQRGGRIFLSEYFSNVRIFFVSGNIYQVFSSLILGGCFQWKLIENLRSWKCENVIRFEVFWQDLRWPR